MAERRIFITGGASGLGRALAHRFAREGWSVCIGDLNEARGIETQESLLKLGVKARFFKCDVTDETQLLQVAQWIEKEWGGLDILVNNAGVALAGPLEKLNIKDWQWLLDINLLGVVRGCKAFLPLFQKQKSGHIVNIASMAGLIHPPRMAPYNAAKAAVVAVSETLFFELHSTGIRTSVVCPSFFRTNLTETSRTTDPRISQAMRKLVHESPRSADEIADVIFRGVLAGSFMIFTEREGKLIHAIKRWAPFSIYADFLIERFRKMQGSDTPI